MTPNWSWHEHHNNTEQPVIWIDGLDVGLSFALHTVFFEPYPAREGQPLRCAPQHPSSGGGLLAPPGETAAPLVYKWRDTFPALCNLAPTAHNLYDGRCLEYRNAAAGGPTLRTFSCWIQMLDGGEETAGHRHTYSHLYHVFEGRGVTEVDDQELAWDQGDCLVVPNWTWHRHRNLQPQTPAILFSMNDRPVLDMLGLLREEPRAG
jgi:gentisate 1,2-dioxygenase